MPALCPSQQQGAGSSSAHIKQQSRWHILRYSIGHDPSPTGTDTDRLQSNAKELLQLLCSQDSTVSHRQAPSCTGGSSWASLPSQQPKNQCASHWPTQ